MWIRPPMSIRRLVQELVFHLFFLHLRRTARIVRPHVLHIFVSHSRQMADEQHQMPGIVIARSACAPGGHSSETHAILDDVVNLAIRKILRLRRTHVRNSRIEFRSHLRLPAAIVPVAARAMIREMPPRLHQQFRRRLHRINQRASPAWNRQPLQSCRQPCFQSAGRVASVQSRRAQPKKSRNHHDHWNSQQQQYSPAKRFHNLPRADHRRGPLLMITKMLIFSLSSENAI
jgi:hypothetical protein